MFQYHAQINPPHVQSPEFYAKFFYNFVKNIYIDQTNFGETFRKCQETDPAKRLYILSEELKRLEVEKTIAGYAVGYFYHNQKKKLGPSVINVVEAAKTLIKNGMNAKKPQYQQKVKEYLAKIDPKNPEHLNDQFADLSTDGAFTDLNLLRKLDEITLETLYEQELESFKAICDKQMQYLLLFDLDEEIQKIKDSKQRNLILRKLVVTNPHEIIVNELLRQGADPLEPGEKSGINAIQRARNEKHEKLAQLLEKHVRDQLVLSENPCMHLRDQLVLSENPCKREDTSKDDNDIEFTYSHRQLPNTLHIELTGNSSQRVNLPIGGIEAGPKYRVFKQ